MVTEGVEHISLGMYESQHPSIINSGNVVAAGAKTIPIGCVKWFESWWTLELLAVIERQSVK
jgi:hypothetical protein